ncbi:MAG TPA: adenylate/guanylate cyclase domain-containing protein [Methylomirabilota bacterium]|nr:adenylate/guanylate cyclase domain-containing protein [Methylomirabilota bacterium]
MSAEPRAYTPRHLVEKILASQSALRGERKLVTVLFADVARSMELAERMDPEEWHRLLDRLFRVLSDGVHRYEGTINQYTGDGIMALFGAPIAHEDHAQRACAAALHLARELAALADDVRRESGLELAVRMGLNSGEVVVGRIGDDLRMDYTAQGHVVGLAARVQALAPPGGIAVTGQTARLAAGFFDFVDRGEHRLKGSSEPVRVFELHGRGRFRSRLERSRAHGFSRFVGRGPELALLERALRDARAGRPAVVLISAEPGAGKSRLCHELVERTRGVAVHHVRALSHGRTLPLHVIVSLARSLFGVEEDASSSEIRDAVLRDLAGPPADPLAPDAWLELLGVSDRAPSGLDPDARRARLLRSLFGLIEARARREPTLIWIEDLHWLDPASETALTMLVERLLAPEASDRRILLLATTRPEYRPPWPARVESLSLAPLALEDSRTLLDDWLGPDPDLAPLRAQIEARARGNPLFVEEMIRSLVEHGVLRGERGAHTLATRTGDVILPETVQAVIASRIDRLADRDKEVLHAAAVVGHEVPIELLRAVLGLPEPALAACLDRLSTATLLGPSDSPGRHVFRHPVAQEVAYRTQLVERRRGTHAAIARALLAMDVTDATTHAALLAHHFDEAGERMEAARWHEQAGRRVARSDPAEGARHCRRVITLLAAVPESPETLTLELTSRIALLEIGRLAGIEEGEARSLFEEARAVAERLRDDAGHAFLLASYGRLCGMAGDVARYLDCAERAGRLAEGADALFALEMRSVLAHAQLGAGRLALARATAERALVDIAQAEPLREAVARSTAPALCRVWWALASAHLGQSARARAALLALLDEEPDPALQTLYGTHAVLCEVLRLGADVPAALAHGRRAVALAEDRGSVLARVEAAAFLGAAALAAGDTAEATSVLEPALALARERRTALWYEPRILATLADAKRAAGERPVARRLLAEACALLDRGRGWQLGALDAATTRVHLLQSEPGATRAEIDGALEALDALAARLGSEPYRRLAALERARVTT